MSPPEGVIDEMLIGCDGRGFFWSLRSLLRLAPLLLAHRVEYSESRGSMTKQRLPDKAGKTTEQPGEQDRAPGGWASCRPSTPCTPSDS